MNVITMSMSDLARRLFAYAKQGKGDLVLDLVKHSDAKVLHELDETGSSIIHWLAIIGDLNALTKCLDLGAPAAGHNTTQGQTPLHWATSKGHVHVIKELLKRGVDVDAQDSLGATALLLAAQHNHPYAWLTLHSSGADPEHTDFRGCLSAHWAAYNGHVPILQLLHSKGINLSTPDFEGYTPLHRAARGGKLDTARFIIETTKADPRALAVTKDGNYAPSFSGKPCSAHPASVIGMAEDALWIVVNSILHKDDINQSRHTETNASLDLITQESETLLAKNPLVKSQKQLISYLIKTSDALITAGSTKLYNRIVTLYRQLFRDPRVRQRAVIPFFNLACFLCFCYTWYQHVYQYSSRMLSVATLSSLLLLLLLYVRLYYKDPGTIDKYGELGPNSWLSGNPFSISCALFAKFTHSPRLRNLFSRVETKLYGNRGFRWLQETSPLILKDSKRDSEGEGSIAIETRPLGERGIEDPQSLLDDIEKCMQIAITEHSVMFPKDSDLFAFANTFLNPRNFVLSRVCWSCGVLSPYRADHCTVTGRCYYQYHYNSSFFGVPIAKKNFLESIVFFLLLAATSILSLSSMYSSMVGEARRNRFHALRAPNQFFITHPWLILAISPQRIILTLFSIFTLLYCISRIYKQFVLANNFLSANEVNNWYTKRFQYYHSIFFSPQENCVVPDMLLPFKSPSKFVNLRNSLNPNSVDLDESVSMKLILRSLVSDIEASAHEFFDHSTAPEECSISGCNTSTCHPQSNRAPNSSFTNPTKVHVGFGPSTLRSNADESHFNLALNPSLMSPQASMPIDQIDNFKRRVATFFAFMKSTNNYERLALSVQNSELSNAPAAHSHSHNHAH